MKTESKIVVPSLSSSFAHFIFGLDVGLLVLVAYFFLPENLLGFGTRIELLNPLTLMLAVPTLFSAGAMGLAWWRPLRFLQSRGVVAALVGVLTVFGLLVLAAGVFLFFVLSRVLTGC